MSHFAIVSCGTVWKGYGVGTQQFKERHHRLLWLAAMARYAFVTRKGLDLVTEVAIPCTCSGVAPYVAPEPDGYRVVFGFFVGQFTLDEIDRFMTYVAASPGSAPVIHASALAEYLSGKM